MSPASKATKFKEKKKTSLSKHSEEPLSSEEENKKASASKNKNKNASSSKKNKNASSSKKKRVEPEARGTERIAYTSDPKENYWLKATVGAPSVSKTANETFDFDVQGDRRDLEKYGCYCCAINNVACRFGDQGPCERCKEFNIRCCAYDLSNSLNEHLEG